MKLSKVFPDSPLRSDWSDLESVQRQLVEASEHLAGLTAAVAKARTIREFSGDRRKRALALATREFVVGNSATAAEALGRGSLAYGDALDVQSRELEQAELVIAEHDAAKVRWESARSVLSALRAVVSNV